jgi:methanethiol S-methyltransferase
MTLIMLPLLVFMYWRLAMRGEQDALAEFGETYRDYMRRVPALVPNFSATGKDDGQPGLPSRRGGN